VHIVSTFINVQQNYCRQVQESAPRCVSFRGSDLYSAEIVPHFPWQLTLKKLEGMGKADGKG